MGKIIVIDESRAEKLFGNIFESAFYPKAEQVIEVQDFLNKNFRKKTLPTINPGMTLLGFLCTSLGKELRMRMTGEGF